MSMYNDIDWTAKNNKGRCEEHSSQVSDSARQIFEGNWIFLGPGDENKCYGTISHKPNSEWNRTAERMMLKFAESGHLVVRGTSPLSIGSLKSRGGGKVSIHFNAEPKTAELLRGTIIAVNQLSIYGAAAHLCNNQLLPAAAPHAEDEAAAEVPPEHVSRITKHITFVQLAQVDLAQKRDEEGANLREAATLANVCADAGVV